MVGELRRQNNHLLMEMDELHFKNRDLTSELSSLQTRLMELEFGETVPSEIHCGTLVFIDVCISSILNRNSVHGGTSLR